MDEKKQYLDYEGLALYDQLIRKFIKENDIELYELKLTDDHLFEIYYKKGGVAQKLSLDLSSLVTEWAEL